MSESRPGATPNAREEGGAPAQKPAHRKADASPPQVGDARQRLLDNPHDANVAPSPLSAAVQWSLVLAFVGAVALAFALIALDHWRRGTVMMGLSLLYLGSIRWVVDSRIMGVLAVRSRKFDSIFCACLAAGILWLAISVDPLGS